MRILKKSFKQIFLAGLIATCAVAAQAKFPDKQVTI